MAPGLRLVQLPFLIWQFTESNFPTFVLPNSTFGLLAASAAPLLTNRLERVPAANLLLLGFPRVLLFNWVNVLVFDLANQRLPESKVEDRINKQWRPLPQEHISSETTQHLLLAAIPITLGIGTMLGVATKTSLILILTWMYNDLRGGDEIVRDVIIAAGYGLYLSSSLEIAIGSDYHITTDGIYWICMISGIILTTMQVQDLKDQPGDRTRGRKTWPLILGDNVSRWMITVFVMFWSITCTLFWDLPLRWYALTMTTGVWVGFKVLQGKDDSWAWKWWCLWQVVIYGLPCLAVCD
ncbi:hypothetical protein N7495_004121 [Penicillium taxi]|uniref:uncharacterized protein n=1 Tax=Penicillium taxi TaxID=168475 RepID=UPI0025455997|nr:uncharacterized protein N7495_004121 [Penicillium taxi]KAJ5899377.1 hypothetical protein N7495_004121 [Penicillium taxi]